VHKHQATEFYTLAPTIFGSQRGTGVLKWLLELWKICTLLD